MEIYSVQAVVFPLHSLEFTHFKYMLNYPKNPQNAAFEKH